MALDSLAIGVQGLGYGHFLLAMQGLWPLPEVPDRGTPGYEIAAARRVLGVRSLGRFLELDAARRRLELETRRP